MSKRNQIKCERTDCSMWTTPRRYSNCCTALEEVIPIGCPFYKTKIEQLVYRQKQKARMLADPYYRAKCEEYGITYKRKGEKDKDAERDSAEG